MDIINVDNRAEREEENSSDLEESNSGQICQTYTEDRGVVVPPTPEDDITETSGVLDRDEGIESEEGRFSDGMNLK